VGGRWDAGDTRSDVLIALICAVCRVGTVLCPRGFKQIQNQSVGDSGVGWVERNDTHRKPSGVARQLVTFLVLPRKVTKRGRPRCAAPTGFPALLDWSGLRINSHDPLRGHVLKHMRRTTPDQPALLGGAQGKEKRKSKPKTTAWALRAHAAKLPPSIRKIHCGIMYSIRRITHYG